MSQSRRSLAAAFGAMFLMASMSLTACSGGDQSAPGSDSGDSKAPAASSDGSYDVSDATITFIPKQLNNPFSDVTLSGGTKAAKELGFSDHQTVGPLEASSSSQVSFINAEVQAGTNVIAIAANDPDAVCPALKEARDAGAKVVTFDSDAAKECRDVFINQVESKQVALTMLEMVSEQIGGKGNVAILSATANATNQNTWIKYMEEEIASNDKYKDITIVAKVYGDDDDTKSFQEAQGLLQSNPDLDAIVSPTTVGIAATARYLSTSEYKGKVMLTGLGLPNEMRSFVEDGTVKEFALWDPAQLGYVAAYAGAALQSGAITGAVGDTFTAGELGERTVEEGGIVVVGDPVRFNKDNINNYDF
ncbi:rhamnose ABC transporter substrate-binding protein [Schaalia sp. ZJ405]|uniref:rhamnose ABC transporter substrate-binding protein n=1 Tax=unclassified Schaalia TaxID=2691889 RepID=UPI0013EA7D5A|nr:MULTISPECIES: rhamnose ABC transporter substrate-binding protein [unclassified Schaalia]QPK81248.1 rhamnose ABC transporter substrate-binding protein [Schaalia sp. ZJ405]